MPKIKLIFNKLVVNFICLFSKRARKIKRLALGYSASYKTIRKIILCQK